MEHITFNEETSAPANTPAAKKPYLVRLLLSTKVVSTDRQAEYLLIGITVLCILLTIFFWPKGRPQANPSEVPPVAGPMDTSAHGRAFRSGSN